jgi:UDP-N-acetylglucosamine:LPS N-acetylglucosamine transferase
VKGNGYIFDSTSVEDLANKLALVVQSDERLNYMKKRSLEIIQEWSYKQIVDSLESWLDFNAGGGFNNDLG